MLNASEYIVFPILACPKVLLIRNLLISPKLALSHESFADKFEVQISISLGVKWVHSATSEGTRKHLWKIIRFRYPSSYYVFTAQTSLLSVWHLYTIFTGSPLPPAVCSKNIMLQIRKKQPCRCKYYQKLMGCTGSLPWMSTKREWNMCIWV
jgi:hypothetical protein